MYPSNDIDACMMTFPMAVLFAIRSVRAACRDSGLRWCDYTLPPAASEADGSRRRFADVSPGGDLVAPPRCR